MLLPQLATTLYTELARARQEVLLASPFLTMPVAQKLKGIKRVSSADWAVLTRLDARSVAARVLSTSGLYDLIEAKVRVYDVPALHAKAFVVDDSLGVVGSANLTETGLGSAAAPNVELSVRLDPDQVPELHAAMRSWEDAARPVTARDLRRVEEEARRITQPRALPAGDLDPAGSTAADDLPAVPAEVTLWVKAQYGEPDWEQWRSPHWFSSRADRYPGFRPGDLVLIYARDAHTCYAVVEVTDEPRFDPKFVDEHRDRGERWPWVNDTRPFFIPDDGRAVSPLELGFDGRHLQNGNKKLDLATFLTALDVLRNPPAPFR